MLQLKAFLKSTRFKTTLWYSSLFLLLEILIGISIYYYLYYSLTRDLDRSLSRQAETVYNLIIEKNVDLAHFEPDSLYSSTDEFVYDLIWETVTSNLRNTYLQVKFRDRIIYTSENKKNIPEQFTQSPEEGIFLHTYTDTSSENQKIRFARLHRNHYEITAAFPLDLISETLNSLTDVYILIAPLFFLISILGGSIIAARSLSRIDTIIKRTQEITAFNLNQKIDGEEFNDEYGRLVRTINEMINRIKTAFEYVNQFSISVSHELKTPLTILRGEIEVALKSSKTNSEYKEILQSNYEEAVRLSNIVDNLFLISKLENADGKIKKQKVRVNDLLNEIKMHFSYYKDRMLVITDRNVLVEIETELMKEAISNLVDNAFKYGDEKHDVILKSQILEDTKLKISVINKGEGIPPEYQSRIFDKFFRMDSSRNRSQGGAGIGLALVKSIVIRHDAVINVISNPGDFTEFFITIKYIPE